MTRQPTYTINWKPKSWTSFTLRLPRKFSSPELNKSFLRLNNRKKIFYHEDFIQAGYPFAKTQGYNRAEVKEWCNANLKDWGYMGDYYYFQNEQDAMLFKMRWL